MRTCDAFALPSATDTIEQAQRIPRKQGHLSRPLDLDRFARTSALASRSRCSQIRSGREPL